MKTVIALLVFVGVLAVGCSHGGTPVKIILPNDYVGRFSITLQRDAGVKPKKEDGFIVFSIPSSGVLVVSDRSALERWHKEVVQYQSGKVLVGYPLDGYKVRQLSTMAGMKSDGRGSTDFDGTVTEWEVTK